MTPRHPQVGLAYEGETIEVDAGIADLLQEVWSLLHQNSAELTQRSNLATATRHTEYLNSSRDTPFRQL